MANMHKIDTPSGAIIAYESNDLLYANGVPYAQAKRFQRPSLVQPWETPFDASTRSPACPQTKDDLGESILRAPLLRGLEINENCLNLSITLPLSSLNSDAVGPRLPVLVWIHGGAYVTGAGDAMIYEPSLIVREHNIVVVMVNYRLGLLGYIGDGSPSRPANLGLLDQIAALKWVQANITSFGGDPRNVTVAGHSAGGDAVVHLLAINSASDLFRRAIIQSAPLGIRSGRTKMSEALFEFSKDLTSETPVEDVVDRTEKGIASVKKFGLMAGMCMATQYGFDPLPSEDKLEEVWQKNAKQVDILIGNTRDEVALFTDGVPYLWLLSVVPVLGRWAFDTIIRQLTKKVYEDETNRLARVFGQSGETWLYEFFWHVKGNKYRSCHAIELILEWGSKETWERSKMIEGMNWEDVAEDGRRFRELWTRFAKGETLGDDGEVERVLKYRKVVSNA